MLGLKERKPVELFYKVSAYGAAQLESFDDARRKLASNETAQTTGEGKFELTPVIGREPLDPIPAARVIAKFKDGSAAMIQNGCAKGAAIVAGFFPALEYSAAVRRDNFDMSRDFDEKLRDVIATPAMGLNQFAGSDKPNVECVLVKNPDSGKRALVVINWAYRADQRRIANNRASTETRVVPFENVKLSVAGSEKIRGASSVALDKKLEVGEENQRTVITLPALNEGDVLLLE